MPKKMLATVVLGIFCLAALLLPGGCTAGSGQKDSPPGEENSSGPGGDIPAPETTVQLYFADLLAVETGERNPGTGFTMPVTGTVPQNEDTARLIEAALAELIFGPGPEDNGSGPVMPATTRILEIGFEDETARINLSREVLHDSSGGTLGGTLFMEAVVLTTTQFAPIERVQVLVEGEPWCDGHYFWEEPLGRTDLFPSERS